MPDIFPWNDLLAVFIYLLGAIVGPYVIFLNNKPPSEVFIKSFIFHAPDTIYSPQFASKVSLVKTTVALVTKGRTTHQTDLPIYRLTTDPQDRKH